MNPPRAPELSVTVKADTWWSCPTLLFRYGVAVGSVTLATLLALLLWPLMHGSFLMLFIVAVVVCVWGGALGPGLLAAALSAAVNAYLFLPPFYSFAVESDGLSKLGCFLVIAGFINLLAFQDIRERRRTEDSARRNEEQFRLFIEHAPVAIAMFDRQMRYLAVSRRWQQEYGSGAPDLVGCSQYEMFPDLPEDWKAVHQRALAGAVERREEDRWVRRDGTVLWIFWEVQPWRTPTGEIGGIIIFSEDITERKRAEDELRRLYSELEQQVEGRTSALRESEERFRIVARVTNDLLYDWDVATNTVWRSDGFQQVFGSPAKSDVHWWSSRIHPDERDRVLAQLQAKMHDETTIFRRDYRLQRSTGDYAFVTDTTFLVRDEKGTVTRAIGAMTEITERKEAEAAQRRLTRQLLTLQEEERRYLARELHDEVMQTLTALQMNLDRAANDLPSLPEPLRTSMALVDDLMEQIRTLSLELRPTMLDELGLAAAVEWYCQRQAPRLGLRVHYTGEPELPRPSPTVETTCFRVIQEAVTNVAKHAHTDEVWISLQREDGDLHLSIRDQGVGFDVEAVRQYTGQHVGIGLRGMEERLWLVGGRLTIRSTPGHGTEINAWAPFTPLTLAGKDMKVKNAFALPSASWG